MHHANTVNESYAIAIFFQADTPPGRSGKLTKVKNHYYYYSTYYKDYPAKLETMETKSSR
jgi:hypothetical protein